MSPTQHFGEQHVINLVHLVVDLNMFGWFSQNVIIQIVFNPDGFICTSIFHINLTNILYKHKQYLKKMSCQCFIN